MYARAQKLLENQMKTELVIGICFPCIHIEDAILIFVRSWWRLNREVYKWVRLLFFRLGQRVE